MSREPLNKKDVLIEFMVKGEKNKCILYYIVYSEIFICQILEQENLIHHTMKSIETYFPSIQYQIFKDFL
jgi:hypothetical protein